MSIHERLHELSRQFKEAGIDESYGAVTEEAANVIDGLVSVLESIARQKTKEEIAFEYGDDWEPDYEGGYDMIVCDARTALATIKGANHD